MHWTESGTCNIPLCFMEGMGYLIPLPRRDVDCRAGQEGMAREGTGQTESSGHLSLAGFVVDCYRAKMRKSFQKHLKRLIHS